MQKINFFAFLIGIEMKEKLREMGVGNGFSCLLNYGRTFVRRLPTDICPPTTWHICSPTTQHICPQNILYACNIKCWLRTSEQFSSNRFEIYMAVTTYLQHNDLAFNVNLFSCSFFPQMLQISNSSHFKSWSRTPRWPLSWLST